MRRAVRNQGAADISAVTVCGAAAALLFINDTAWTGDVPEAIEKIEGASPE
jgi:hypothetical protein